jgi:hypothetical protein
VTLFATALYPAALSLTGISWVVAALAAIAAIFSAGVDLSLFDELMKRIPRPHGVTFTSIDTTLVNAASIFAPLLGGAIAVALGIEAALLNASTDPGLACVDPVRASDSRRSRQAAAPTWPPRSRCRGCLYSFLALFFFFFFFFFFSSFSFFLSFLF